MNHATYAKKNLQDLFSTPLIRDAIVKELNAVQSVIAYNKGNGRFTISPLHPRIQLSSVNAIHTTDLNKDGFTDLVLGGNMSGFLPQLGRLDASWGHVIMNDSKGHLHLMDPAESGLEVSGEVRDIIEITGKGRRNILLLRNDDYPVFLKVQGP